ncbi:hypothetical protein HYX06_06565 [Candidatus Woesearchaeota archaeon]|nr:hypothetical protein [Candidatus Woesearchaeota archaeon]
MIQKNILVLAIILIALLSACQIETQKEMVKKISTRAGDLTLKYENGQTTLSGILQRSTPCVNWTVQIGSTKDLPISSVNIDVFNSNKGAICIQVLGEPQEIKETISQVSENTGYTVKFEEELVFSGKLE